MQLIAIFFQQKQMPESYKFQVFKYKIYVLAIRIKGITIIYQILFCQHLIL